MNPIFEKLDKLKEIKSELIVFTVEEYESVKKEFESTFEPFEFEKQITTVGSSKAITIPSNQCKTANLQINDKVKVKISPII